MTLEDGDADERVFARVLALVLAQFDPRIVVEEAIRASSSSSSSQSKSSSSTLDARASIIDGVDAFGVLCPRIGARGV
jgi:hypothetical protein